MKPGVEMKKKANKEIRIFNRELRWPEIFVIPSFVKVKSPKILTVENRPKISCLSSAFYFCECLNETNGIIKNFAICRKCQK